MRAPSHKVVQQAAFFIEHLVSPKLDAIVHDTPRERGSHLRGISLLPWVSSLPTDPGHIAHDPGAIRSGRRRMRPERPGASRCPSPTARAGQNVHPTDSRCATEALIHVEGHNPIAQSMRRLEVFANKDVVHLRPRHGDAVHVKQDLCMQEARSQNAWNNIDRDTTTGAFRSVAQLAA